MSYPPYPPAPSSHLGQPLKSAERAIIFFMMAVLTFGVAAGYFKTQELATRLIGLAEDNSKILTAQTKDADSRQKDTEAARERNRQIQDQLLEAVTILKDCTTPSTPDEPHECADRSAAGGQIFLVTIKVFIACLNLELQGWQVPGADPATIAELAGYCGPVLDGGVIPFLRNQQPVPTG